MILVCGKQKTKELTPAVAQAYLQIQKAMGNSGTKWELPKNSPYEFIDNALIKRADKKDCTGVKKPKGNPGRNKAPGKTEVSHGDDTT
jgi:hypothetical protein